MSIFGSIMDKIFHHADASTSQTAPQQSAQQSANMTQSIPGTQPQAGTGTPPRGQQSGGSADTSAGTAAPRLRGVDVDNVLSQLASQRGGGGNWRTSVVDLLKLLDLDPSLTARKELANELNVHVGPDGTAEQNIALQKAVMSKLAENGGKVPDSLRH